VHRAVADQIDVDAEHTRAQFAVTCVEDERPRSEQATDTAGQVAIVEARRR